jgi:hypothetical protein
LQICEGNPGCNGLYVWWGVQFFFFFLIELDFFIVYFFFFILLKKLVLEKSHVLKLYKAIKIEGREETTVYLHQLHYGLQ